MQYNVITYSRNKNLGNYESEKLEMTVTVEEHENVDYVLRELKIKIAQGLGLQVKVDQIDEVVEGGYVKTKDGKVKDPATGEEVKKKKTTKKVTKKKTTAKKKKEEVKVEVEESNNTTIEMVKAELVKVWKAKGKPATLSILKEFMVEKADELDDTQYNSVIVECTKALG